MRLAQDIRDGSDIPNPERNSVKIICIIREGFQRQCLGIYFNKSDLRRCTDPSSAQGTGKKTPPSERRARTVVIHRLFEAHVALLQHLSVNIDYVYVPPP
jgi:hypothetical protein